MSGIVSLMPAATEIVLALDLADELVGVTHECAPSARQGRAVVVTGRSTDGLSPAAIDALVAGSTSGGPPMSVLDRDAFATLDPTLVVAQDLCAVCALPAGEVDQAMASLGCDADLVTLDPSTLADVLVGIAEVAALAGVPDRGEAVVAGLRQRLAQVCLAVEGRVRPRVTVVEWTDPVYLAGHWIPDLVELAGGFGVGGSPGARSRAVGWDAVRAARPEVVVVAPCGYDLDGASRIAEESLPQIRAAAGDAAVWAIDADGLVVRPGPRLVDGVEAMASLLHPDAVEAHPGVRRVA